MQIEFKIWSFKKKWPNERLYRKEAFFSLSYVQDIYSNCYKSAIELNQVKEGRKRGRVEKEHGN